MHINNASITLASFPNVVKRLFVQLEEIFAKYVTIFNVASFSTNQNCRFYVLFPHRSNGELGTSHV